MIELKNNYNKMAMRPKGEKWEWYTARVGSVLIIHVHNQTRSEQWNYEINTFPKAFDNGFATKEEAFEAAIVNAKNLLQQALRGLEK